MRVTDLDSALWAVAEPLLLAGAAAGLALTLAAFVRVRVRVRTHRPRPIRSLHYLSLVGLALAFASPAAPVHARRVSRLPWQGASRVPPPPLLAPPGPSPIHPALHPGSGTDGPLPRLFVRAAGSTPRPDSSSTSPVRTHEVRPGDTLWSIAELVLETNDPARIARYWPRIHRHNRRLIGPDPNLIRPGQILRLPEPEPER